MQRAVALNVAAGGGASPDARATGRSAPSGELLVGPAWQAADGRELKLVCQAQRDSDCGGDLVDICFGTLLFSTKQFVSDCREAQDGADPSLAQNGPLNASMACTAYSTCTGH